MKDIASFSSRRYFLNKFAATAVFWGINPLEGLSLLMEDNNLYTIDNDPIIAYANTLKRINNLRSLKHDEIERQNYGIQQLLIEYNKVISSNISQRRSYRRIKNIDLRSKPIGLKPEEITSFYKTATKETRPLVDMASLADNLSSLIYSGANCAAGIILRSPKLSVPGCLGVTMNSIFTINTITGMIGNEARNEKSVEYNTLLSASILSEDDFFENNLSDDTFSKFESIPWLEISLDNDSPVEFNIFPNVNDDSFVEMEFKNYLNEKFSNINELKVGSKFEEFLQGYAEKIGAVQKELIASQIEAFKKSENDEQLRLQDKIALYKSVSNLLAATFPEFFSSKEGQVFSLLASGFVLGTTGVGWVAVGINIASVLISHKNEDEKFSQAIMAALQQIQEQLTYISKQLDGIHYTQIEVLDKLNEILDEIIKTKGQILRGLDDIARLQKEIYIADNVDKKQRYSSIINEKNNLLENALINNIEFYNDKDVYEALRALQSHAINDLSNRVYTQYIDKSYNSEEIKNAIFQPIATSKFNFNVSLYDSIGIVSAIFDYSPEEDRGFNTQQILHPFWFYLASNNIIYWAILSNLKYKDLSSIVDGLLNKAEESRVALNNLSSLDIIESKSLDYRELIDSFVQAFYKALNFYEMSYFLNSKTNVSNYSLLSSNWSSTKHVFSSRTRRPDTLENQKGIGYSDHINDREYFQDAMDFGLFKTIAPKKGVKEYMRSWYLGSGDVPEYSYSGDPVVNGPRKGRRFYDISIAIEFNKILISFEKNDFLENLTIEYEKSFVFGEEHPRDSAGNYRMINGHSEDDLEEKWKQQVKNHYYNQKNIDIAEVMPEFEGLKSFSEFTQHLLNEKIKKIKNDFIEKTENILSEKTSLDGVGIGMFVLSKLNKLINSDYIVPYVASYDDELLTRTDIETMLKYFSTRDLELQHPRLFYKLRDFSLDNYLNIEGKKFRLNAEKWKDAMCLLVMYKSHITIEKCLKGCSNSSEFDSEPSLADTINRLNWFKETFS